MARYSFPAEKLSPIIPRIVCYKARCTMCNYIVKHLIIH